MQNKNIEREKEEAWLRDCYIYIGYNRKGRGRGEAWLRDGYVY